MPEAVLAGFLGLDETGRGPVVDALNIDFDEARGAHRRLDRLKLADLDPGPYFPSGPGRVELLRELVLATGERVLVAVLTGPLKADMQIGTIGGPAQSFTRLKVRNVDTTLFRRSVLHAVVYKNDILLNGTDATILRMRGSTVGWLPASAGSDQGEPGARSYLYAPPKADSLIVWRNRLLAIRGDSVGISADDNDPHIPAGSHGVNVWPGRTNFTARSPDGSPIIAAGITPDDRLLLLARRRLWLVDEDEISPVAKVVETQQGCIAARSLASIGTAGFIYLSDRKIVRFHPTSGVEDLSEPLRHTVEELIDWDSAHRAVGVNIAQRNEYRLWVPIRGSSQNRLCLVYDYRRKTWRKYAGWWLFDDDANQGAAYDVTAATTVLRNGRELLLTGDSQGRLWLEDAGEETQSTTSFPAFVRFRTVGSGMATMTYRDWRAEVFFDGAPIRAHALHDDQSLEQELMRWMDSLTLKDQSVEGQLAGLDQSTYVSLTGWNNYPHVARWDALHLSFGERAVRMSPVLVYPGAITAGSRIGARGGIRLIEFVASEKARRAGAA